MTWIWVAGAIVLALSLSNRPRRARHRELHGQAMHTEPSAHVPPPAPHLHQRPSPGAFAPGAAPPPVSAFVPPGSCSQQSPISLWRLLPFLLIPPYAAVLFVLWVVASFPGLLRALGALIEVIIDSVVAIGLALSSTLSRTPDAHARLVQAERVLMQDATRLARSVRVPLMRFASWIGVAGIFEQVGAKWQRAASALPGAPDMPMPPDLAADICPWAGRYHVLERIPGAGSSAELYVVRRLENEQAVGDKLLLKSFDLTRGAWLENLVRESEGMRLAKRVGLVVDYMFGDDYFYYVMPFHEGETLARQVAALHRMKQSDEGLSEPELRQSLAWVRQVLVEVERYHANGLIHKDIKPENIIVGPDGAKLVDVGLVTQLSSAMTLTTHGTEYFRDPELVRMAMAGKKVNEVPAERFDLYSVGALLYFVVEGTFPATGRFSRYQRPVPYAIAGMANKAMSDIEKRYHSAGEMLADIDAVLSAPLMSSVQVAQLPSFRAGADSASAPAGGVPSSGMPVSARSGAPRLMLVGVVGMAVAGGLLFSVARNQPSASARVILPAPTPVNPVEHAIADCRRALQQQLAISPERDSGSEPVNLLTQPILLDIYSDAEDAAKGARIGKRASWDAILDAAPAEAIAVAGAIFTTDEKTLRTATERLYQKLGAATPILVVANQKNLTDDLAIQAFFNGTVHSSVVPYSRSRR